MLTLALAYILVRSPKMTCLMLLTFSVAILSSGYVLGEEPLIELKVQDQKFLGKRIIHDHEKCVLMLQDGAVKVIPLNEITGFRKTGIPFKPYSMLQMRNILEKDFTREYEVKSNSSFIVVAPDGYADRYLTICQEIKGSFYHYFGSRGFKLKQPEYPLVMIVLKDKAAFREYGKSHDIKEINMLAGLYSPVSNQIVMYQDELTNKSTALPAADLNFLAKVKPELEQKKLSGTTFQKYFGGLGTVKSLEDTVCHELTHQLAYNANLHTRSSDYPRWVIEGLAMTFESPGNRSNSKTGTPMSRINLERYLHFKNYITSKRSSQMLEKFLFSEENFTQTDKILDAYAESWALTFFLIETRPGDYVKYLQLLLDRPLYTLYKPSDRVNDFKLIFGNNLNVFEVQYLKYYEKLY